METIVRRSLKYIIALLVTILLLFVILELLGIVPVAQCLNTVKTILVKLLKSS